MPLPPHPWGGGIKQWFDLSVCLSVCSIPLAQKPIYLMIYYYLLLLSVNIVYNKRWKFFRVYIMAFLLLVCSAMNILGSVVIISVYVVHVVVVPLI